MLYMADFQKTEGRKQLLSKLVNLKIIYQHFKFRAENGIVYSEKTRFLPGSLHLLPASDIGGEINMY